MAVNEPRVTLSMALGSSPAILSGPTANAVANKECKGKQLKHLKQMKCNEEHIKISYVSITTCSSTS